MRSGSPLACRVMYIASSSFDKKLKIVGLKVLAAQEFAFSGLVLHFLKKSTVSFVFQLGFSRTFYPVFFSSLDLLK